MSEQTAGPMEAFLDSLGSNEVYLDEQGVLTKARELDTELTTLREQLAQLTEALRAIQPDWCAAYCTPEPKGGEDWVHDDICDRARAALAAADAQKPADARREVE